MNYKKTVTITTLSVIAVFALASFTGFEIPITDAQKIAQPEKFVFVEKITTTALFEFRDGTELAPIQIFSQTGGFGTATLSATIRKQTESSETTGRAKPAFTMEKILGGTPHLYEAADQAQKYILNGGFDHSYKFFDVTVYLAADGNVLRSFEYSDCEIKSYNVVTRSDNEEGYTGKGFAIVDQFSFECRGYTPLNPAMDAMKKVESAKTISSSDLRSTDQWTQEFKVKP